MSKKKRVKTYSTMQEGGWEWESVYWSWHEPFARVLADFLEENGLHVIVRKIRYRKYDPEYYVFVPRHELPPVPGLLAVFEGGGKS